MANLVLRHAAKLSQIKQMWHLQMVCCKFAVEVNPFFRPVQRGDVQRVQDWSMPVEHQIEDL